MLQRVLAVPRWWVLAAVQAVAGADTNISVISVVESRVVKLLKGEGGP